jgi:hypothetical protein
MKKEYVYIGLALAAVGGFIWWSKNNKSKINSDAKAISDANIAKQKDALTQSIKSLISTTDWSNQKSQYSDFDLVLKRLNNTINANIMSTDELSKVNDALLLYNNQYVGTKTNAQIGTDCNNVFIKYGIQKS